MYLIGREGKFADCACDKVGSIEAPTMAAVF
jgi:hypothetical protein